MKAIVKVLFITILLSLLFSGCGKEPLERRGSIYTGERLPIDISVSNSMSIMGDAYIESVRVIIFNQNGLLIYNDLAAIKTITSQSVTLSVEVARGSNHFYVICNENVELSPKLKAITRSDEIEKITFEAAGTVVPLPMYGRTSGIVTANRDGTNVKITVDGAEYSDLTIKVMRMVAKFNLDIIKNIPAGEDDFTVEGISVKICRMPKITSIKEGQPYTSKEWANNITLKGIGSLSNNGSYDHDHTTASELNKITFPDIYIPEHILTTPAIEADATYLLIDATCKMNKTSQILHSIYTINLGQNPPDNHNIKRNNEYNIYATIKGIGAMGIYAEIIPMDMHDITIGWKSTEGLVVVSDKIDDYDINKKESKNMDIWNDYNSYYGILKIYTGTEYKDIVFKYGSLFAIQSNLKTESVPTPFIPPSSASELGDILWYPSVYTGGVSSWGDVPFIASGNVPVDQSLVTQGMGDPCKLVGFSSSQIKDDGRKDNLQWRMATAEDYRIMMLSENLEANEFGYKSYNTHILPNAKSRNTAGALDMAIGNAGNFWTTTATQRFGFTSNPFTSGTTSADPSNGYSIRCVRTNIPVSEMFVIGRPLFGYGGNTATGGKLSIASNIPYWTATLIDNPSDPHYGGTPSEELKDFSFTPGTTNVHTISGRKTEAIPVYVKRKESMTRRMFNIRITGRGYDGVEMELIASAIQEGYSLVGDPVSFVPTLSESAASPEKWVPNAGQTYRFSIKVTPTDVALPAGKLQLRVFYNGSLVGASQEIDTQPTQYTYDNFSITIAPNSTPAVIGLNFMVYFNGTPIGSRDLKYYQNGS